MATFNEDDVDWTLTNIKEFIDALMDITLCNDIQDLKDHLFLKCIWKTMEEKLCIDSNILKIFWLNRLHLQLFCVEPIYLNEVKIKLIKHLYEKGIKNKRSINWSNVTLYFDGFTSYFLYYLFVNLIKVATKRTKSKNFKDHIKYLYNEYIPLLKEKSKDKILPRLLYSNGNIVHKDTDLEVLHNAELEKEEVIEFENERETSLETRRKSSRLKKQS